MSHYPYSQSNVNDPIPITITICGDGGCGKSSITLRLVRSQWTEDYDPTIEDSYSVTRRIDGRTYYLSLTDTAGQEEYRSMWASSNLGADAFLLVYDITSRDSLDALGYFNELIDMEAETRRDNAERARRAGIRPTFDAQNSSSGHSRAGGASMYHHQAGTAATVPPVKIVAGNKCDLQANRQVPASVGMEWAQSHGCGFMETSARLEVNIEETFAVLVRKVAEARRVADSAFVMELEGTTAPPTTLSQGGSTKFGFSSSSKKSRQTSADGKHNSASSGTAVSGVALSPKLDGPDGDGRGASRNENKLSSSRSFLQRIKRKQTDDTERDPDQGGGGAWRSLKCW